MGSALIPLVVLIAAGVVTLAAIVLRVDAWRRRRKWARRRAARGGVVSDFGRRPAGGGR